MRISFLTQVVNVTSISAGNFSKVSCVLIVHRKLSELTFEENFQRRIMLSSLASLLENFSKVSFLVMVHRKISSEQKSAHCQFFSKVSAVVILHRKFKSELTVEKLY